MLGKSSGLTVNGSQPAERRRGHRFQLGLPCRVTLAWGESQELFGKTSNISRSGVKVVFENIGSKEELPRVGVSVRILIDLPHGPHISPRCLECLGVAMRSETLEPGRFAVAFEIRRIRICDRSGRTYQPGDSLLATVLLHGPVQ